MSKGIMFIKTSTCKASFHDTALEYLDENSEYSKDVKSKKRESENFKSGVNYLQKEMEGSVNVGGFFHTQLAIEGGSVPEKWDNESRKKGAYHVFQKHLKKHKAWRGYTAHKMVFSMSEDLEKKCRVAGVQPEDVLVKSMKNSIRKFQKKFHKGDQLGYAWGIHHDTDNLHIHVLMSNKTKNGKVVGMSQGLKNKADYQRKFQRKEHIIDIKKWVADHENTVHKYLDNVISGKETNKEISKCKKKEVEYIYHKDEREIKSFESKREKIAEQYWTENRKIDKAVTEINITQKEIKSYYSELKTLNEKGKNEWKEIIKDRQERWERRKKWFGNRIISTVLNTHDLIQKQKESLKIKSFTDDLDSAKQDVIHKINVLKSHKEEIKVKLNISKNERRKHKVNYDKKTNQISNLKNNYRVKRYIDSYASYADVKRYYSALKGTKSNDKVIKEKSKDYLFRLNKYVAENINTLDKNKEVNESKPMKGYFDMSVKAQKLDIKGVSYGR